MIRVLAALLLTSILCALISCTQPADMSTWTYLQLDDEKGKWGDWDEPEWLRYFGLDRTDLEGDGFLDVVSERYVYHNPTGQPSVIGPQPGDVFREYVWLPDMVSESGKFLRVGGRVGYMVNPDHFPPELHHEGHIGIDHSLDLEAAVKAEVVLERIASHEDTRGLEIQINGKDWIQVPNHKGIPEPQSDYMFHAYPVVPVPLEYLNAGIGNTIKMKVDSTQRWNWPQNLFYGIIIRIYYGPEKTDLKADLRGLDAGQALSASQPLQLGSNKPGAISSVDFVGLYEDFNWEGDGIYRQWHYHYHKGKIRNHIGTATDPPFQLTWDISWLPDQNDIAISARVVDNNGLIYMAPAVGGLQLRRDYSVELAKPHDQPKNWVTRADSMTAHFSIHGNVAHADAVQLAWRSWSPCYARGVFVNGFKVYDREDPCYDYAEHLVEVDNPKFLRQGENSASTGKTPLIDGKMVHGMEVQWPGIMVKVRYRPSPK